jgi:catechol 2,3-dioxygenase-like lactoylglutathione lyase family enzyme
MPVKDDAGLTLTTISISAPDPPALATFYQRLLGYSVVTEEPDWVMLRPAGEGVRLSFQTEPDYLPPVWPGGPGDPKMMMHLEIQVDDLETAGKHARDCGAILADFQPQEDVRVYLDPAGHPFCLWVAT